MKKLKHLLFPPPPPPSDFLVDLYRSKVHLERISRRHSRALILPDGAALCRVLGKFLAYVNPSDASVAPHLMMSGCWESWISIAFHRLIKPGMHCVDGGANAGYFALLMADAVWGTGKVMAIEANPALVKLFQRTIPVNGMDGFVSIRHNAIADSDDKTISLYIPPGLLGSSSVAGAPTPDSVAVDVTTVTLDTALKDWPQVDFIKLDIEGAEYMAWRGMQKTIAKNRDITLVLEFAPCRFPNAKEFLAEIAAAGFELRYIDVNSQLVPISAAGVLAQPLEGWMLCLRRPRG